MLESVRRFTASLFDRPQPIGNSGLEAPEPGSGTSSAGRGRSHPLGVSEETRARVAAEVNQELERLQGSLAGITLEIEREREYGRTSGTTTNRTILDALQRRATWTREKMERLGRELAATRSTPPPRQPPLATPRPPHRASRDRAKAAAGASGQALTQVARLTLKKGRFRDAAEKAIFAKLTDDLADGSPEIHLQVIERLGELKCLAALPVLRAALRHDSEELRIESIRAVLEIRHGSTRDLLVGALADPSHRVRVWAIRGLYGLDDAALPALLRRGLADGHPQVRRAALTYVAWKRIESAEHLVLERLGDPSDGVRRAAVLALGHCGSETSVFRLICLLRDDEPKIRTAAIESLQKLLGEAPELSLDPGETVPEERLRELKQWWTGERVRRVLGETEEGGSSPTNSSESPETKVDEALAADPASDDPEAEFGDAEPGETPVSPEEAPVEEADDFGAPEEEEGLDAEPDLGSDFDGPDTGFVAHQEDEPESEE